MQIAAEHQIPRSTIGSRVQAIRRKLTAAGLPAPLPTRGRRRDRVDAVRLDPADLARLTTRVDASGRTRGRWIDQHDGATASEREGGHAA